jgi:hypothetical protein
MHEWRSCLAALLLLLSGASWADEVEKPLLPEKLGEEVFVRGCATEHRGESRTCQHE